MAVAILSPWPASTATVALAAARACLRLALDREKIEADSGDTPKTADETLDRLGMTAAALVESSAAGAPQPIKNEAAIRLAGWLRASPSADMTPTDLGGISFDWRPAGRNALRNSGAAGLLAPWHRPRAMVLEASS